MKKSAVPTEYRLGAKKTIVKNALARPAILLLPSDLSDEPGMNGAGKQLRLDASTTFAVQVLP